MKNDNENLVIRAVSMFLSLAGLVLAVLSFFVGDMLQYWWFTIIGMLVGGASGLFVFKKDKMAFWFGIGCAAASFLVLMLMIIYVEGISPSGYYKMAWHYYFGE